MILPMKLSASGGNFIRNYEAFRSMPYKDIVGNLTWGYGHKRQGSEPVPKMITAVQALALFACDITPFEAMLNHALKVQLNQNQFDAMMSILYNTGPGVPGIKDGIILLKNGKPSTMLNEVNASAFDLAAAEFPKWDNAGGKEVEGLLARRKMERRVFQTPVVDNG